MFWSFLFVIGLAQGIFLISVFVARRSPNPLANRLLVALLALFALSNLDDLLLATRWYTAVPWLFGGSIAALFAYGPLFYCYVLVVTDTTFVWKRRTWLHFLPASLYFLMFFPVLLMAPEMKIRMLDGFLAGQFPMRIFDVLLAVAQTLHFAIYVVAAYFRIERLRKSSTHASFHVPLLSRIKWLYTLVGLFSLILLALVVLTGCNISAGRFIPNANFGFTLFTAAIMYFIAYKLIFRPALVTPGFAKKYAALNLEPTEIRELTVRLKHCLETEKIFTDPELKLQSLAKRMDIPPHLLSMLINDKFGSSFSDFINQRRVDEFIILVNDPRYAHYSLHGLALEVGFNSKSAFNVAFKKITGRNPSDFRK